MIPLYLKLIILSLLLIGLVIVGNAIYQNNQRTEKSLRFCQSTYLRKQGGTSVSGSWLNYDLRSFDGGLHWYAVDMTQEGVVILGDADTVYPGLLSHIDGLERLIKYVKENGPIQVGEKMEPEALQVLNDAGMTVEE